MSAAGPVGDDVTVALLFLARREDLHFLIGPLGAHVVLIKVLGDRAKSGGINGCCLPHLSESIKIADK